MTTPKPIPHVETVTERIGPHVIASTIRPATGDDLREARALADRGACDHRVIVDDPGWLYDFRSCWACGQGLGTV